MKTNNRDEREEKFKNLGKTIWRFTVIMGFNNVDENEFE